MTRRKKLLIEKIIDFINKESKTKEGDNPMFYSSPYYPPGLYPPPQGGIDPFAFHKFVNEELEKERKAAEEKKKKDENKVKWPFSLKFSFAQTALITMTIGLVGGYAQLQMLYIFKQALLRTLN